MNETIALVCAVLAIGFIVWWFFGTHVAAEAEAIMGDEMQEVEVTISGGYTPSTVVVKQGVPARIIFERKDPSGCFNEVMFPDYGINETLPVNKKYPIEIDTSKAGEYQFSCGMHMFHGKVVVK